MNSQRYESFSRPNSRISRSFLYRIYLAYKRATVASILFLSILWIIIFIYNSPVFVPIPIEILDIPIRIGFQKKFYCVHNITSYNIDPKIILDIKNKFNNSLEQANSFILDELEYFQKDIDEQSSDLIGYVMTSILVTLNCENTKFRWNSIQNKIRNPIRKAVAKAKEQFLVSGYGPEVFWSKHGLYDASTKILDYIKTRDIVDIGAFCGDSLLVLLNYTDKTVYSFEYSPANIKLIETTINNNFLDKKHIKIISKGISNKVEQIKTDYEQSPKSQVKETSSGNIINMTTIDVESKKYNMNVGFMKADIEGMELYALEGAVETIKRDRPIISFSIYHNFDGLFRIRHFIDRFPNYTFQYKLGAWNSVSFGELIIFAYPKELD